MKKQLVFALAAVLALVLCGFSALSEGGCDDALDKAFETGSVVFGNAGYKLPDTASCEIVMPPDEFWQFAGMEPMNEAEIRALLAQADFLAASYAPDGKSGIGILAVGEARLPFAMSENRLAVIWPQESRGVYDSYGVLAIAYRRFYLYEDLAAGPFDLGEEGAIWSPGGRYCCTLNSMRVLIEGNVYAGAPIIVDTKTGELFALDTFRPKLLSADGGYWIAGCFSGDEKAFYVMTATNRYDERFTLVRYDMETFEAAPCTGFSASSLPAMTMLSDGRILTLIDARRITEPQALVRIAPDGSAEMQELMLQGDPWFFRALSMRCAPESDWALLRGAFHLNMKEIEKVGDFGLQRLSATGSAADDAEAVWVLSAETRQFQSITADQMPKTLKEWETQFKYRNMRILDVTMSPGGRYAAVLAVAGDPLGSETALLIVRLEDMAALSAQGIDLTNIDPWGGDAKRGKYLMSWSEAGLLLPSSGLWQLDGGN